MFDWRNAIDSAVDARFADLICLRRHLHAHPELSGDERNTVAHLAGMLATYGISNQTVADGCGLLIDLDSAPISARSGRFGIRADLDALQIHDEKTVDYRSQIAGVMHACGHDVHATIVMGTLQTLHELREKQLLPWPIRIRGIFQPAEEICLGASAMIEAGALNDVCAACAFHVDPFRDVGCVGFRSGVMAASCDELRITIEGFGGHAARPHHTRDPITAAAQFLNSVHVQVPRGADSLDTVVIGFGSILGGDQCNVIPSRVEIRGTLRALRPSTREASLAQVKAIADGVGRATRTGITVKIGANTPAVSNDEILTELARQEIVSQAGTDAADEMSQPSMGGEDFAYYLQHVPGILLRLGSKAPDDAPLGLHTSMFDVDEEVIRVGVRLMSKICIEYFSPNRID